MKGAAIIAIGLFCAGCGQVADAQGKLVQTLRVRDAVGDYERARTPLDRCVKAKLVAAAYSDAKDVAETEAWEARTQADCREAAGAMHVSLPPATARP